MTNELLGLVLALPGHAFLWIGLVNRLHSIGAKRRIIKRFTLAFFLAALTIPILIGVCQRCAALGGLVGGYVVLCWIIAPATLLRLVYFRWFRLRTPEIVRSCVKRPAAIDVRAAAVGEAENRHHFLVGMPGNEILRLELRDWVIDVPRLPAALEGLSIVHLSDFHFTGRVGKAYFREVVRTSNELRPDIVALTGDIIDARECFDWIADALGRLTAAHGVFCILGNHDLRVGDIDRVRRSLERSGLIYLGNQEREIRVEGCSVLLAGNERPWINGPDGEKLASTDHDGDALRIVLSHSPDQLGWARAWNADLMLAGHTHGGQIRIPPLGAIFSPCADGVKYVSGVYYEPPTILHVSRGVSGDIPVRWNCRPEISRLRLRCPR